MQRIAVSDLGHALKVETLPVRMNEKQCSNQGRHGLRVAKRKAGR
jgi:hypothetical protein